jgi:ribosome-dependent ATPase
MVPAAIMQLMFLIPCMLTALSVVREKELGSIANFYSAPATRLEFLLGKQLPYFAVALVQFASLIPIALFLFHVPMKGSWPAFLVGGLLYLMASTGFGLLISVFAPTQTAALFAAAIITTLPAIQFSGMYAPVSSLTGSARFLSKIFPSTYFQAISVGTFTKAIGFSPLLPNFIALSVIAILYFVTSVTLLPKQER